MSTNLEQLKSALPAAHVYDVDQRTGFMAPRPPIRRLPEEWEQWEAILENAVEAKVQLGDKFGLTEAEAASSGEWRRLVRQLPILPITNLLASPILLRRAHVVLAYTLHFYVQSLPPKDPVAIPKPISIPLLRVSQELDIPPVLTFADTALYNWDFRSEPKSENAIPSLDNIRSQTLFTGSTDEEEFYLCASRIELQGVEILELMRITMDETFVGDSMAVHRIAEYLHTMAGVINELKQLLLNVKQLCDPDVYYNQVRPWFRGEDSLENNSRKWIYEGLDEDPGLRPPTELSGPSAGQSSMVHVMDIYFGVDHQPTSPGRPSFMSRMQSYMPLNHRKFLNHLKSNPRPLRQFVMDANDKELLEAYNCAVLALKEFRDAHMIIAALYILGPARRAAKLAAAAKYSSEEVRGAAARGDSESKGHLIGTGGTHLVKFLKDTRTRTTETLIP